MTILDYLSLPERLGRYFIEITEDDNAKIDNLLTVDILECLCWRRGALLYMYCHTMYNDSNRFKSTETTDFIKDSQEGVYYLHKMLNVRSPLDDNNTAVESNDNTISQLIQFTKIFLQNVFLHLTIKKSMKMVESNDNTTAQLIKKGIFSDTHVLALMYAGELYYWQWKIQQQHHKSISELPNTAQDILTNCKHYLTRYISTVLGPLQGQGWDTIKAEQYLKELN